MSDPAIVQALHRIADALEGDSAVPTQAPVLQFLESVNPQQLAAIVDQNATLDTDPITATLDVLKRLAARL